MPVTENSSNENQEAETTFQPDGTFFCEDCQWQTPYVYECDKDGAGGCRCLSCGQHYRYGYAAISRIHPNDATTAYGATTTAYNLVNDPDMDMDLKIHDIHIAGNPRVVIIDEYARERPVRLGALLAGIINVVAENVKASQDGYPYAARDLINLASRDLTGEEAADAQ